MTSAPGAARGEVSAVLVAGGSGTRMGGYKQLLPLAGKPMLLWSIEAFLAVEDVAEVVVVMDPQRRSDLGPLPPRVRFAAPGATRMGSVRSGVAAAKGALLAVHDGARPLVDPRVIRDCLQEARRHGAAVAAVPSVDTLKEAQDGWVRRTPERAAFWAAQTPQCYRREVLEEALAAFADDASATDESQLVERLGKPVKLVPSGRENLKVTTPEDVVAAEAFLARRLGRAPVVARTGSGFDLHRLVEGRPFVLGGLTLEHPKGPLGHSDGDVLLHALCDAVLGAAAAGEIGQFFPPGEAKTRGLASREIAEKVLSVLAEKGGRIVNLDATVVSEAPALKPHYDALRRSVAGIFRLELEAVSVKAKSNEGLGEIGRGEALSCHAVATVLLP